MEREARSRGKCFASGSSSARLTRTPPAVVRGFRAIAMLSQSLPNHLGHWYASAECVLTQPFILLGRQADGQLGWGLGGPVSGGQGHHEPISRHPDVPVPGYRLSERRKSVERT